GVGLRLSGRFPAGRRRGTAAARQDRGGPGASAAAAYGTGGRLQARPRTAVTRAPGDRARPPDSPDPGGADRPRPFDVTEWRAGREDLWNPVHAAPSRTAAGASAPRTPVGAPAQRPAADPAQPLAAGPAQHTTAPARRPPADTPAPR